MVRGPLILDRYEPLGTAGAGGFGTVRIAWDPRIQRKVAIKTIGLSETDALRARLPGADAVGARDERGEPGSAFPTADVKTADRWHGVQPWKEFLEQDASRAFAPEAAADAEQDDSGPHTALAHLPGLDEARTAAMLSDSRIVTVFDFEVRGQTAYLIMEYVEGLTLTRLLDDYGNRLTLDMIAAVFDAVAGALGVAHKAGVLHLDIKPDNIIVNADGQAKVTDFGLATLADASGAGTTGGGTIGYMPLEQMRREPLDARTDEWSLASLTYEMLTGENPFRAPDLASAERAIEDAELVLPSLCWDDVDEQIDDVVFYALDPDPEGRYASVADFAEELDKFLGDAHVGTSQLAAIVTADIDPPSGNEGNEGDEGGEGGDRDDGEGGIPRPRPLGFIARFMRRDSPRSLDGAGDAGDEAGDAPPQRASGRPGASLDPEAPPARSSNRSTHRAARVPPRVLTAVARMFAALASGATSAIALQNMAFFAVLGDGAPYVVGAGATIVALVGLAYPSVGALVSFIVLGLALAFAGQVLVGLALAAAAIGWWLAVGREGMAAANVALAMPWAGMIGASTMVPFAAGSTLRVLPSLVTGAFAAGVALVFAALGSGDLVRWDPLAIWTFSQAHVDVAENLLALVTHPATWAIVAGWLAAAVVLSLLGRFAARWLHGVAVALAVACVLVGTLAFTVPSPELFLSVIFAAVVLGLREARRSQA